MNHDCFLCSEENPDRSVFHEVGSSRIRFAPRFEGPKGTVNGGVAIAALGCLALAAGGARAESLRRLSGRLHRPVPLDKPLTGTVLHDGAEWRLEIRDGSDTVLSGSAEPGSASPDFPAGLPERLRSAVERLVPWAGIEPLGDPLARTVGDRLAQVRGEQRMEPSCFGCLKPRGAGGLDLPGHKVAPDTVLSRLAPDPTFRDAPGVLALAVAAAAADCQSGMALFTDEELVGELVEGRQRLLTGSIDYFFAPRLPTEMEPLAVAATPSGGEGRRLYSAAALLDARGRTYVAAEATWIRAANEPRQER